jgi:hypothetical protein
VLARVALLAEQRMSRVGARQARATFGTRAKALLAEQRVSRAGARQARATFGTRAIALLAEQRVSRAGARQAQDDTDGIVDSATSVAAVRMAGLSDRPQRQRVPTQRFLAGPASGRVADPQQAALDAATAAAAGLPMVGGATVGAAPDVRPPGVQHGGARSGGGERSDVRDEHVDRSSEPPAASETLARLRGAGLKRPPQLDWDYARVQFGIEKHPLFGIPNDVELLQLQQYCIDIDREAWPERMGTNDDGVIKIPHDLWVKLDQELGVYVTVPTGKRWLPRQATAAHVSACVLAHSSGSGHCSIAETQQRVATWFDFVGRSEAVHKFVASCLHCLCTRKGNVIPRPLASTMHGRYFGHVLRMDFLYLSLGNGISVRDSAVPYEAILVLRDDATELVDFWPVSSQRAVDAAAGFVEWVSRYNKADFLIVDGGSHFKNQLFDKIKEHVGMRNIVPTLPNAHRTAGSIEIMNKLVLNVLRSLLSELHWPVREWPRLLAPLRHYLNNKPRQLLKDKAPIELALGIPREDPLSLVIDADAKLDRAMKALTWESAEGDLRELMVELARATADAVNVAERTRSEQRRRVNKVDDDKFDVPADRFEVGDYILRSIPGDTAERILREKLLPTKVPMQVVMALSPSTYMCRDLATQRLRLLHGQHMQLYAGRGTIICDTRLVEQARHDRAPVEYSHFEDYAVLMDEAYLLARYVTDDSSSGFGSEWLSWSELKSRHSVKELKELFAKSSTWLGDNADAQRLLTRRVNAAKLADDSS